MKKIICLLGLLICLIITNVNIDAKIAPKKNLKYNTLSYKQNLDIYYPDEVKENNPVIIFFHGGSYHLGSKYAYMKNNRNLFTKKGYVYVSVNYRLNKQGRYPAAINDAKTAIRYLKTNANKFSLDPNKFIVLGHSAGANLSSLVASTPHIYSFGKEKAKYKNVNNQIAGSIHVGGFYDYKTFFKQGKYSKIKQYLNYKNKKLFKKNKFYGNSINYSKRVNKPMLIIHGTKDKTVKIKQAAQYCKRLNKQKKKVTCKKYRSGHSLLSYTNSKNGKYIINWLDKNGLK